LKEAAGVCGGRGEREQGQQYGIGLIGQEEIGHSSSDSSKNRMQQSLQSGTSKAYDRMIHTADSSFHNDRSRQKQKGGKLLARVRVKR
jgi:hypothetical protein